MKKSIAFTNLIIACLLVAGGAIAQEKRTYKPIDESVPTNEVIDSKIGKLKFPLGYPTEKTAQLVEDEMLYII